MRRFTCSRLDNPFDMGGTPIQRQTKAALAAKSRLCRRVWGLLANEYSAVRLNSCYSSQASVNCNGIQPILNRLRRGAGFFGCFSYWPVHFQQVKMPGLNNNQNIAKQGGRYGTTIYTVRRHRVVHGNSVDGNPCPVPRRGSSD